MIIGQDLMVQLGLIVNFNHDLIKWGNSAVPMKPLFCQAIVPEKQNIT